ncbi:hypothetical protein CYCD_20550 [Tenuifilaceae bacterium CYCD]|nr:hypothetical protein CYCD_20550 [Tenuifilaceae bacterium CYCD]
MISADDKAFLRDYEVDSNQTFLAFHNAIQDNLGFDPTQLASFFLADEHWNKGMELTLIDMQNEGGLAAIPMDSVKISELIKDRKERLLYVYDIFTDHSLFLELLDILEPTKGVKYPICSASVGEPPVQLADDSVAMPEEDFEETDEIDDIFGEFDSDEFGAEGFDGSDE